MELSVSKFNEHVSVPESQTRTGMKGIQTEPQYTALKGKYLRTCTEGDKAM